MRRAKGEGSLSQRKDGSWAAQIQLPDGKRKSHYSKTKKEGGTWLKEQRVIIENDQWHVDEKITIAEFMDRYFNDVLTHNLRPKSLVSYEYLIRDHIKPDLGTIKLFELRPAHLQALYSKKLNQGLSKRTVQYVHAVIHKALRNAMKWGMIISNPADLVDPPRPKRTAPLMITSEQASIVLDYLKDDRLYNLYLLAISTGMREGELLGLFWEDIDFNNGTVHVQRAVQALPAKGLVFVEPKTENSRRTIPIPQMTQDALRPLKGTGLIFHTMSGKPISPRNLLRHFHNTLDKLAIPRIKFHALRHTFASLMFSENVHPKVVQEMLGHSTIMLTMDTYSHLLPSMQSDASAKMNALLTTANLLRIEKNTAYSSKISSKNEEKEAKNEKKNPPYMG